ncbi:MAG: serine hydrolase domain-containing protein [Thermodesulfobacteriota bacterium]|jgi:CubicO group peptidase (beta-lactamase class C family)
MKTQRCFIFVFSFIFLFVCSAAVWGKPLEMAKNPEALGFSSERLTRIDKTLQPHIEKGIIPGATILIGRHGKIAYFKTYGMQDKNGGVPMKKDTIFRIYSMSKPITAVAMMMLWEEGKFILNDPVSKFLPELKGLKVGEEKTNSLTGNSSLELVPCNQEMTIHDLLRHTSGMIYEFPSLGKSLVQQKWAEAKIWDENETLAEATTKLSKLPLLFQPRTKWNYGRSYTLLGRLIEVLSGQTFDQYLEEKIFKPLGMKDSGFWVKPESQTRVTQGKFMPNVTKPPKLLAGGEGLVATTMDYARFAQMLLNGGSLDGVRILGPKTVAYMTSDHLGSIPGFWFPGISYGLGFGVRMTPGVAFVAGSVGTYNWGGYAGTAFWVDPKEDMLVVFMINEMIVGPSNYHGSLIRDLVYQAMIK